MDTELITLTVNGKDFKGNKVLGKKGQTVLEVLRKNDIHIPTLCYHPKMPAHGGCRLWDSLISEAKTPGLLSFRQQL